jgi:hypothetical protein
MPDLVIRGMDMPKTCYSCKLKVRNKDKIVCPITKESFSVEDENILEFRLSNCPTFPLPKNHGRIVDANEVLEKADKAPWFDGDLSELGLLLGSEVTTIVPAEGGTDE